MYYSDGRRKTSVSRNCHAYFSIVIDKCYLSNIEAALKCRDDIVDRLKYYWSKEKDTLDASVDAEVAGYDDYPDYVVILIDYSKVIEYEIVYWQDGEYELDPASDEDGYYVLEEDLSAALEYLKIPYKSIDLDEDDSDPNYKVGEDAVEAVNYARFYEEYDD